MCMYDAKRRLTLRTKVEPPFLCMCVTENVYKIYICTEYRFTRRMNFSDSTHVPCSSFFDRAIHIYAQRFAGTIQTVSYPIENRVS